MNEHNNGYIAMGRYAEWQAYWYDANYDPKVQQDVA